MEISPGGRVLPLCVQFYHYPFFQFGSQIQKNHQAPIIPWLRSASLGVKDDWSPDESNGGFAGLESQGLQASANENNFGLDGAVFSACQ